MISGLEISKRKSRLEIQKQFLDPGCRGERVVDKSTIKEYREYVKANEAAAKEFVDRFFYMQELSFSEFKKEMLAEFQSIPLEDIKTIPGVKYDRGHVTRFDPVEPALVADAAVPISYIDVPESLGDVKFYKFALRFPVSVFARNYYFKNLEEADKEEMKDALSFEEHKIRIISVFHFSSLLPVIQHQCPLIDKAIKEYEKFESIKELWYLTTGAQYSAARALAQ